MRPPRRRRSRRAIVAFALLASIMLATVPAALALQTKTIVGSQHTTDTDFENAAQLNEVSVVGSGQSANVEWDYNPGIFSDSFEDEPADAGTPDAWEQLSNAPDAENVSTVRATDGSQSYFIEDTAAGGRSGTRPAEQPYGSAKTANVSVSVWANESATDGGIELEEGGTRILVLTIHEGNLSYYDGTNWQTITTAADRREWVNITVHNVSPANDTLSVKWEAGPDSGITTISTENAMSNGYDETQTYVRTAIVTYDQFQIGDVNKPESGTYLSQNHTIDRAHTAKINLTLANASATVTVQESDGGAWADVNSAAYDTSGNKSLDISAATNATLRTNVTFTKNGSDPTAKLHDESILFTDHEPGVNNSTASPSGGEKLSSQTVTLQIDISDGEFPTAQGDNVTGTFKVKEPGTSSFTDVGSDYRTSNGTLSVDYDAVDGGTYEWKMVAEDSYGLSNTSDTFTFQAPENVTFRNESNASQIVTGISIQATFYSADGTTIIEKTDSNNDGNISLAGLPVGKEFVVVIEADEFYTRRVYIESIYQQQNIFLLNSTAFSGTQARDTTFEYEDRTGEFPPDVTTLRIQRALDIDDDGNFSWTTIAGDFWGAGGEFPFTGEDQARYRLIIENAEETQRELGTHIPTEDGTKTVVVGNLKWPALNATGRFFNASLDTGNQKITILYQDPTNGTTDVRFRIWERGNKSNEIYDQNFTGGPYGRLAATRSLTSDQVNNTWVVNYTATHDDDGAIAGQTLIGANETALPVDPWLLGSFGWLFITFVACLYGPRTSTLGAWVLVATVGVIMIFQWVMIPTASLIAAAGVAAGGTLYTETL